MLPSAPDGKEMLPEAMLFYLLTGKVPSQEQTKDLVADLAARSELDDYVKKIIDSFRRLERSAALLTAAAKQMHPMTQFVAAVASLKCALDCRRAV